MSSLWQIRSFVRYIYTNRARYLSVLLDELGIWTVPLDNHRLAEMEFYLVDELECDLTVFHPYRTLTTLCAKELKDTEVVTNSHRDPGNGVDSGERYWGTDAGKLILDEKPLQLAWLVKSPCKLNA